jgi:hypothetical protein
VQGHSTFVNLYGAQRNQRDSPLLLLPAELCNKNYGYVLARKCFEAQAIRSRDKLSSLLPQDPHWLALLFVYRQVYTETAVLPFKLNMFGFETNSDLAGWIKKLLPGQGEAIESLRFLRTFCDIYIDCTRQEDTLFKEMSGSKAPTKRCCLSSVSPKSKHSRHLGVSTSGVTTVPMTVVLSSFPIMLLRGSSGCLRVRISRSYLRKMTGEGRGN